MRGAVPRWRGEPAIPFGSASAGWAALGLDVAIAWGQVNTAGATLSASIYWQSATNTLFPAGLFAAVPRVILTSTTDTTVPITWGTKVVTTSGFSWRAVWDDHIAHSAPGDCDWMAIGLRAV